MNRTLLTALAGLMVGGLLLFVVTRCDPRESPEPPARSLGERTFVAGVPDDVDAAAIGAPMPARFTEGLRLVSLSPAMSRALVDMGLEASIIGRSGFCDFLDPAIPVAGDLLRVDAERIIALEPTHVLRQPPARDDTAGLRRLAAEQGWAEPIVARLDGIADVRAFVLQLPRRLADPTTPMEAALAARAAAIDGAMGALIKPRSRVGGTPDVDPRDPDAGPPSLDGGLLLVHAIRPPGVFGQGTYLDDMLTARGVANAFTGLGWRTISTEDLLRLDPAAIVLVSDRPTEADRLRDRALETWDALGLRAVRDGRVVVLADRDVLRPSTGLISVGPRLDAAIAAAVRGDAIGRTDDGEPGAGGRESTVVLPLAPGDRIGRVETPPVGAGGEAP